MFNSVFRIWYLCSDANIITNTCQGQNREFIVPFPCCCQKLLEFPSDIESLALSCHESDFDVSHLRIITLHSIILICVIGAGSIIYITIVSVLAPFSSNLHGTKTVFAGNRFRLYPPRFLCYWTLQFAICLRGRHCWSSLSYWLLVGHISTYIVGTIITKSYGFEFLKN
jgi:hypothetical protein